MMPPRAFIYDHQHQKYFQQKHITPRKIIILRQQFSLGTHQDNHNNKNQKYTIAAVSKSALQQTNCRSASFLGKINLCTLLIVETRFQGCMYYYCEGKDTLETTPAEISFCCFGSPATLLSIYIVANLTTIADPWYFWKGICTSKAHKPVTLSGNHTFTKV